MAATGITGERQRARIAGSALIASPVLWFVGAVAFFSTVGAFYNPSQPMSKLNAIAGQRLAWTMQSVVFLLGTLTAVVGLVLLASLLRRTRAALLARVGAIGALAAAAIMVFFFLVRVSAPLDGVQSATDVPALLMAVHFGWLNVLANSVILLTVMVFGVALVQSGRAIVMGGVVAAVAALVLLVVLIGGPLPAVIVYPIAAVLGVRLLFWKDTPA